ncbi:hypothetical protein BD324DRAFT_612635 [Kockovaella imperatae]|uniref:Uncharacterized protein n=1 Tax=Kockovaella imperatae TaxID=4999 RepID=A0A1Y1UU46_9TREE|nr:hypothetical protein BD324DRAFT_612635 [Kockovaella imperatae]ORX40946.1 hypothetical protein BD324DRAFT_612635 [Kockovaella imperatae]
MSRSTSGASDAQEYSTRLLTPHSEYRPLGHGPDPYSGLSHDIEMRKMSESLGRMPSNRLFTPAFTFEHVNQLGPHPQPAQPELNAGMARGWGAEFALSSERGDTKVGLNGGTETDYEREREQQIMTNKKLIEEMGLGGGSGAFGRSRSVTGGGARERSKTPSKTPIKKRLSSAEAPVRASPRIASLHRASYADLDGNAVEEVSDEYQSSGEPELDDEDDFRPPKRTKTSTRGYGRKASYTARGRKSDLSLWGLLQIYPEIPRSYPLFYYTLNNDLSINSDSVPLIGSIPSTATALEKADNLQAFYHRGRRVLSQLDAFTARCDRKYEGPQEKLTELDHNTRIAVRDVRRKIVERCENYKYTRRDLLDKACGKNKWAPIEHGLIEWRIGMAQTDPAGDLSNVTLTLPTPPPQALFQGSTSTSMHQQQQRNQLGVRQIKPFPRSRIGSVVPLPSARTVSVTMGEPSSAYNMSSTPVMGYGFSAADAPPPMYGEDDVPMSVQLSTPIQPSSESPLDPSHPPRFHPSPNGMKLLPQLLPRPP